MLPLIEQLEKSLDPGGLVTPKVRMFHGQSQLGVLLPTLQFMLINLFFNMLTIGDHYSVSKLYILYRENDRYHCFK